MQVEMQSNASFDPTQGCRMIGASRVYHGIKDAFLILHSPPGCHSGLLLLKALYDNADVRIAFSGMHPSRDFVYGAERKVLRAIEEVHRTFNPKLIAIVDCCAPAIIGDDLEAMLVEAKEKGVTSELLFFSGAGFQSSMWQGYEEALASLAKFMEKGSTKAHPHSVNLLGFKDDEMRCEADLFEIKRVLRGIGVKVNATLTSSKFDEIIKAPEAQLNLLLGGDGLRLAELMKDRYDIPYEVVDYPYGAEGTEKFLRTVCRALGKKTDENFIYSEKEKVKSYVEKVHFYLQGIYGLPCAVIGDACKALSLAKFLSSEIGLDIKVLALTSKNFLFEERLREVSGMADEVMIEPDRIEMEQCIKDAGVQIIFGSTFDKRLANAAKAPLVRFSYPTIDSISLIDAPYAGFRGVSTWLEFIINSLTSSYY
ncbi:MAG: nitrogenase [Deltaproteobacteria bacterium]|nr:MAG: nitrogenase [Deltaproteobacteria bacterium]